MAATPGAQAASFALELTGTLESPVPIRELSLRADDGASGPAGPCSPTYYTGDPTRGRFAFREGSDVNGCLGVTYALSVPSGIRRVTLTFVADRVLAQAAPGIDIGAAEFEQEVRLRADSKIVASSPYFGPQQGTQPGRPFAIGFDVPTESSDLEVEWWFANQSPSSAAGDPSAGRLQAWSSTVSEPAILLEGIQLDPPRPHDRGGQLQGESYLTGHTVDIGVPPQYAAAAAEGRFALHLRMPASTLVDRLLAPDGGDLKDEDFETAIAGSSRSVTLPGTTLARLGPGPYAVRFQASEALQVEPGLATLTIFALAMPPIALAFAAYQLRRRSLHTYLEAADALEGELAA